MKQVLSLALFLLVVACAPITPTPEPTAAPTAAPTRVSATATPRPTAVVLPTPTPIRKGGEFKQAVTLDAKSFHVYQTTDATSRLYQNMVYASGLWQRDAKTLAPIPGMADQWTISPDGRVYTFNLRKDMKWSDGTPITADDFEWTYSLASNPANRYPYIEGLKDIASLRATDDYVLEIQLKQAICTGLVVADSITPLPRHVWGQYSWTDPAKNPEVMNPTVVSGPYKLKEWKQNDHATFVRNEAYYRGATNFDSTTVRVVSNAATQMQLLKSGEIDFAPVAITDYDDAKKSDNLKLYEWSPDAPEWDFIGLNLRRAFLKNVAVRRALATAMPRQQIVDQAYRGLAKPMFSTFAPTSWVFNPDVARYDYNIDAAKSMLQAAGYKLNAQGKLVDKDNKAVPKLKILYNTTNKRREQVATMVRDEFKKLGLDADAVGMEFQAYQDYLKKDPYDYDMYVLGWRTSQDPYFTYQLWSQDSIPAYNAGAYVNADVEKLFEQANRPPCDVDARKKVFQQIQKTISDDAPYIFLAYQAGYAFVNKRIVPNEPSKLGIDYLPEQWYSVTK